jgi:hypothetical protein
VYASLTGGLQIKAEVTVVSEKIRNDHYQAPCVSNIMESGLRDGCYGGSLTVSV